jgi:hypothetical protein
VDVHGRESSAHLLTRGVLFLLVAAASATAQRPSTFDDLLPELVAKIASAVPAGAQLGLTVTSGDETEETAAIQARVAAQLAAGGLRTSDANAQILVSIGCGRNLRERVCVAEIRGDGRDQLATVTRRFDAPAAGTRAKPLALALRPLLSQQNQILDVAVVGDRLLVLDVAAVTLFEQRDGALREVRSRPLGLSRPLPRDPRGRIGVDGGRLDLFLPGATCTGRTDTLEIGCSNRQQPWPIGADNSGLEPGRNYFKTPTGMVFYNAAPLGAGVSDDAISLTAACTAGTYVAAVSGSGADGRDLLQLSRVADGRLVQAASPLVLPGILTALWPQADQTFAVVVTHDVAAGRYDAFQASVSCSR